MSIATLKRDIINELKKIASNEGDDVAFECISDLLEESFETYSEVRSSLGDCGEEELRQIKERIVHRYY